MKISWIILLLILARWVIEFWLRKLNEQHVLAHARAVPAAFKESIDEETYAKSVRYTLARSRLSQMEASLGVVILALALFSGVLSWAFYTCTARFGQSAWVMAAFLFGTVLILSLPGLPLDWYAQFRLEERFGFSTTTQRLWWLDRFKGVL